MPKRTLLDWVDEFKASYISRSKYEKENKNNNEEVADDLTKDSDFGIEGDRFEPKIDGKSLTPVFCRKLALTAPGFIKGSIKKSKDTFRAGFDINKNGKEISEKEKDWLNAFNKRNNILTLLSETKFAIHVYGEAIWYVRFEEELKKKVNHASPPPENALPYRVKLLDPEKVVKFEYKNKTYRDKGIKHLLCRQSDGKEYYVHPSRLVPFYEKKLPFSDFGISDVVILRHIINSIADVDIGTGKTLKWFSHGIIEWTRDNANKTQRDKMKAIAKTHPDIYIGNEKYHLKIHNPRAIDPEPFYDYLWMCIAAVLVLPTHVLKGVEVGRVTGAEAGYSDYYRDIEDLQNLVYSPRLTHIYQRIFDHYTAEELKKNPNKPNVYVFDYDIQWNPTYVNEQAEAELDNMRADTIDKLGKNSVLSKSEERDVYNRGHIKLDINKIPDQKENKDQPKNDNKKDKDMEAKLKLYKAAVQKRKELDAKIKAFQENPGNLSHGELEEVKQELRLKKALKGNLND